MSRDGSGSGYPRDSIFMLSLFARLTACPRIKSPAHIRVSRISAPPWVRVNPSPVAIIASTQPLACFVRPLLHLAETMANSCSIVARAALHLRCPKVSDYADWNSSSSNSAEHQNWFGREKGGRKSVAFVALRLAHGVSATTVFYWQAQGIGVLSLRRPRCSQQRAGPCTQRCSSLPSGTPVKIFNPLKPVLLQML